MKKVLTIYLSRLRNEEDFGFHRLVVSEIPRLTGEGSEEEGGSGFPEVQDLSRSLSTILQERINTYKAAYEKFDEALKDETQVPAAALVSKADELRDEASRKLRNYAKLMTEHPVAEKAAIAQEVVDILNKYDDPTTLPQTEESGVLHNIMQDIEKLGSEKREKIHIDEWSGHLQDTMDAYDKAVAQRAEEESGRTVGIVKAARQETDEAYRTLISGVNAFTEIEGDAEYAAFIDALNSHIKHLKTTLKQRDSQSAKKDKPTTGEPDAEEPEPEEPDTETPDTETPDTETPDTEEPGNEEPDDRPVVQ